MNKAGELLNLEFHAPGIEVGWFYPVADIANEGKENRHDGQLLEDGSFNITEYHPSTIPGHNLPHAWLQRQGATTSTRDLVKFDRFVLLTQTAGIWDKANNDLVDIEVTDGESSWTDREGMWAELSGTDKTGAILVRPDGIVAWRVKKFEPQALSDFPTLLKLILKQDKSTP